MSDPVAFIDGMFAGDVQSVEIRKSEWLAAKAELIARRHGLTAEQVEAARESLLDRVAERMRAGQETAAVPYAGNVPGRPSQERFENDDGSDHACSIERCPLCFPAPNRGVSP